MLTTALGENRSDFLVYPINPYVAVGIGAVVFAEAVRKMGAIITKRVDTESSIPPESEKRR